MNFRSKFNDNNQSIKYNLINKNSPKFSKSILESINIIYDDDFISLINKITIAIKDNYKFIKQIINKIKNISININNQNINNNLYLCDSMKLNIPNNSQFYNNIYDSLNHNIFLIDKELNTYYNKIQNIFKKMKLIRSQKMKNIIEYENYLYSLKGKDNFFQYFSSKNDNNKRINAKDCKTRNNSYNNNLRNINNSTSFQNQNGNLTNNKYYNLKNLSNLTRPNSLKTKRILNNNNYNSIYINNHNCNLSQIDIYQNKSIYNSMRNSLNNFNNSNHSKLVSMNRNRSNDLNKFNQLKNELIDICGEVIESANINDSQILEIKIKKLEQEKIYLLKEIKKKEKFYQNIVIKYKKDYNELLQSKSQKIENNLEHQFKDNIYINNKDNNLMENLKNEINKKDKEINQLKNKINFVNISLDSSLSKNKELKNFINELKANMEKLKVNINSLNSKSINTYNNLIITHNFNLIIFGENFNNSKEKKYILKDYILATEKEYNNLKWFLLKYKGNNNSKNYKDYIWVDADHLNEKENNFNEKENDLFKFCYLSHKIKNKNFKFKDKKDKFKEEINNKKHSFIISNTINNQYFIINNKNWKNADDSNKSFSFSKKLDNNDIYKKLMNFNKIEKNLKIENNDMRKLDTLAISKIEQENNDEENSLINEIKNINNNKENLLDKINLFGENRILNEEAFMKTYNSAENELEAAKNQLFKK